MAQTLPFFFNSNYAFIQIPKDLYRNPIYQDLSNEAKIIYGFLLDRTRLSYLNGKKWRNPNGDVFVFYTQKEVAERLNCGHDKAGKIMKDLEQCGLIRRIHQKPGLPPKIVLREFQTVPADFPTQTCPEISSEPIGKPAANKKKKKNDPNKIKNNPIDSEQNRLLQRIQRQIQYDQLQNSIPDTMLNIIIQVMADAICSEEPAENIGDRIWSREELTQYLLSVNSEQIVFVYDCFQHEPSDLLNPYEYFLPKLCQADEKTMKAFYDSIYKVLPAEPLPSMGA